MDNIDVVNQQEHIYISYVWTKDVIWNILEIY